MSSLIEVVEKLVNYYNAHGVVVESLMDDLSTHLDLHKNFGGGQETHSHLFDIKEVDLEDVYNAEQTLTTAQHNDEA